jgi:hypothetical protein
MLSAVLVISAQLLKVSAIKTRITVLLAITVICGLCSIVPFFNNSIKAFCINQYPVWCPLQVVSRHFANGKFSDIADISVIMSPSSKATNIKAVTN